MRFVAVPFNNTFCKETTDVDFDPNKQICAGGQTGESHIKISLICLFVCNRGDTLVCQDYLAIMCNTKQCCAKLDIANHMDLKLYF